MAHHPTRSYARILRDNAFSPINVIIFAIGAALLLMGLFIDAFVTVGLVLLNVAVAVVQEGRAKRQLDRIALLTRPKALVIREGREREIDPAGIVLGDLLKLETGDQVVADGHIVDGSRIEVDESLLTGESEAVLKSAGDLVYSGSFLVSGAAIYEVDKTGEEGLANRITAGARAFRSVRTPVQREIDLILRVMAVIILAIAGPVAIDLVIRLLSLLIDRLGGPIVETLDRAYQNYSVQETVRSAAVVVSLVPQGLAMMLTIAYAMGAVRLAGKGALLQRANAVESLSHVDVLCLDKTGTLTTNRLTFHGLHALAASEQELAAALADIAAGASSRNRTLEAIADAFPAPVRPAQAEVPFSSERKWSAVAFESDRRRGLYILGAPEVLRPHLASGWELDAPLDQLTSAGLRVLLLAGRPEPDAIPSGETPTLPDGLTPLGLISLGDEIQPAARETIDAFRLAGVRPLIISGDHPDTVAALARQAGFGADEPLTARSGLEMAEMDDAALDRAVERTTVFGRVTPDQKPRLVQALQRNGHYVAMVGDGVNDVLALKQAQVGIAMQGGSQATRAVADLVLLGNSFAVLPAGFREGQRIVRGTQDLIKLFLARSLAMVLIIIGVGVVSGPFPVTPRLNALPAYLVIGFPTLVMISWARPGAVPRNLLRSVLWFSLTAALTIAPLGLTLYVSYLRATDDVELARTIVAVTATLCGLILIPFVEPPAPFWTGGDTLSGDRRPTILAVGMLGVLAVVLAVPGFRSFFELRPLAMIDLLIISAAVLFWMFVLRAIWRHDMPRRFFGLSPESGPG
jgi:cation-transporting ATPase E